MKTEWTPMDIRCLELLAEGKTQKEIARYLNVPPSTAEKRLQRIYVKLGAVNGPSAVAIAFRKGLLE